MRILLTKTGQEEVQTINDYQETDFPQNTLSVPNLKLKTKSRKLSPSSKRSPKSPSSNLRIVKTEKSISNLMDLLEQQALNTSGSQSNRSGISGVGGNKQIKIKTNKIQIGKKAAERYNNETVGQSLILPNLRFQTESNQNDPNEELTIHNEYSIKEIIGREKYKYVMDSAIENYNQKQKHYVINENNFRSDAEERNYLSRLETHLNQKIAINKSNLINYLSQKKKLSNVMILKIAQADEHKRLKMNKACQINNHFEGIDDTLKLQMERSLVNKKRALVQDYKKNLQKMNQDLENIHIRLHSYEGVNFKNVEAYKDNYQKIQKKYWNFKIDKLHNPKMKKDSVMFSQYSVNKINKVNK